MLHASESQGDDGARVVRIATTQTTGGQAAGSTARGRGRAPLATSQRSRYCRAATIAQDLLQQAHQEDARPKFFLLRGTSINIVRGGDAPTMAVANESCAQNVAAMKDCIERAICSLERKYPGKVILVVTKLEVKGDNQERNQRVDAHGVVAMGSGVDIDDAATAFMRYMIAGGAMCRAMHNRDTTLVAPLSGVDVPHELFKMIQHMLKASNKTEDNFDRTRTRQMLASTGIEVVGHSDDVLVHYHMRIQDD
ncbi:hypothetical protein JKP88DRAFT_246156 [Tribonema minus]|uniref:Uncharacterized protein n=1 Tax=Tribonema minus TaxID=303371 RepID=A0A835YY56_9STRA|nr:hypothetical protein JKP88DRAFT_246156 [Tribonema minus]